MDGTIICEKLYNIIISIINGCCIIFFFLGKIQSAIFNLIFEGIPGVQICRILDMLFSNGF